LERKKAKKEVDAKAAAAKQAEEQYLAQPGLPTYSSMQSSVKQTGGPPNRSYFRRGKQRLDAGGSVFTDESGTVIEDRPAFCSQVHGQSSSSKKIQPRPIAIPYCRFRKERFYDWPPDPTVSRATPMMLEVNSQTPHDRAPIPDMIIPGQLEIPSSVSTAQELRHRRNPQ
jgi:hypothetical protein